MAEDREDRASRLCERGFEMGYAHSSEKSADQPLLLMSDKSPEGFLYRHPRSSRRTWIALVVTSLFLVASVFAVLMVRQIKLFEERRWNIKNFRSFITFGDSWTGESRYEYFYAHNSTLPEPGTLLGENLRTIVGGRVWARYVVQYAGSSDPMQWKPQITLYNYAFGGSWCSDELIARGPKGVSVLEGGVPSFIHDMNATRLDTTEPFFQPPITPSNAVFALWIGVNDLGMFAYLSDDQVYGKTLLDFTECNFRSFDALYAAGARTFVLMNTAPLQLAPAHANTTSSGGERIKDSWMAGRELSMTEAINNIFRYQTLYEFTVSMRYPGARVALFDVNSLLTHLYYNPGLYLNGSAAPNVTGFSIETEYGAQNPDSFMWRNNLHPSEQTSRIIAAEFVKVLDGKSTYAQYW
ncbi:hypothetical protein PV08_07947 [Exophiala spinifera]|uniref:Uncharacterized protein n=1 Tax=Exophiala spinifera TaxID=91928 RepID=A0A0D1YCT3_9EURO|nr:uncharacterized protein PV08_07947 [Exophiala spinifera]KIW12761.1 hypothetical protein PV08_07947 [Exophiala spinifera]